MGLLDFLRSKAKLPKFSVCIYGKLPCHREYLHVSVEPAFNELRSALIQGIDVLTQQQTPPPLIEPDRRFFVRMDGFKVDLAGCIWDSRDDGGRAFPFLMAVPLPKKYSTLEFPLLFAGLSHLWRYLEHYFDDLRGQPSGDEVYRRVRNVVHDLDPPDPPERDPQTPRQVPRRFTTLDISDDHDQAAQQIADLSFDEPPAFLLWPTEETRLGNDEEPMVAHVGFSGIADFRIEYFRSRNEPTEAELPREPDASPPESEAAVPAHAEPAPPLRESVPPDEPESEPQATPPDNPDPKPSGLEDTLPNESERGSTETGDPESGVPEPKSSDQGEAETLPETKLTEAELAALAPSEPGQEPSNTSTKDPVEHEEFPDEVIEMADMTDVSLYRPPGLQPRLGPDRPQSTPPEETDHDH